MTCKDCIHSEVCIIRENIQNENYADKCGYSHFEQDLERPQGEWIPVSEKLPEYSGLYLISVDGGLVTVGNFSGTYFTHRGIDRYHYIDPDAWMPLPEPYKKGEEK